MSDPTNLGATQVGAEIEHSKLMKVAPHLGEEFKAEPLPPLRQQEVLPEVIFSSRNDENFKNNENVNRSDTSFDADMDLTPAAFDA